MVRRASFAVFLAVLLTFAAIASLPAAPPALSSLNIGGVEATVPSAVDGPIRLARHPDFHSGKIAFSYLGDIWTASENGSGVQRITDHSARDVFPRFSPDGKWIAFSSNRYGGSDVFVASATGGAPKRLTFHSGGTKSSDGRATRSR